MKTEILVVDDEPNILNTLEGILSDEGFNVILATNGREALEIISERKPDLTLLDIWLPEVDGIEVLQRAIEENPLLKIVMMSGHSTIDTAVKATKIGAKAFIEKPISMDDLLSTINTVLNETGEGKAAKPEPGITELAVEGKPSSCFTYERPQKTLKNSIALTGLGLHSGTRTGIMLNPAEPNTGIVFEDINSGEQILADIDNVISTGYATALSKRGTNVKTVEHLLSALHMYGITNLRIKVCDEVPIFDGSALELCETFDKSDIVEQDEMGKELVIDKEYIVFKENSTNSFIKIEPSDTFEVEFMLSYPEPVGEQTYDIVLKNLEDYKREIAPARTFGFAHELRYMQKQGVGRGGQLDNVILVDKDKKYISQDLRFEDEFVRHKILDIVGDMYLIGCFIRGKITAHMTGHTENIKLLQTLREELIGN